jgi:uncharacterized protein (TIGR04255 family)
VAGEQGVCHGPQRQSVLLLEAYTLDVVPRQSRSSRSPHEIVTFGSPPINEVAIGVQFSDPLIDDGTALADFWPRVRGDFPSLEKQPPLPPIAESFGYPPTAATPFQFLPMLAQRYWLVSKDETRLIQIQSDRLILNWRQRSATDVYPRYRSLRNEFERRAHTLSEALGEDRRDLLKPSWCEVTYVNNIDATSTRAPHRPLSEILRLVSRPKSSDLLPPEDSQFQQRSLIPGPDNEPIGRLYVIAAPAVRADDARPIYILTLTVRAQPTEGSLKAMYECFDRAHVLIVKTFLAITTPAMHRAWDLKESHR